ILLAVKPSLEEHTLADRIIHLIYCFGLFYKQALILKKITIILSIMRLCEINNMKNPCPKTKRETVSTVSLFV
ncbi:MAG: hypothetical protein RR063_12810, partial [Anaerovoracaceae bacterium]